MAEERPYIQTIMYKINKIQRYNVEHREYSQ